MTGSELCNDPDRQRLKRNSQGAFPCLFRYLTAKNSCGVTRSICLPQRESKQAAQPPSDYRRVQLEMGGSPGLSARWPAFYDGRNSNVGLRALTLGLIALEAQPCPDRAVLTLAWPDKVNNQQPINYFRGREKLNNDDDLYTIKTFSGADRKPPRF